jgi:O-antigen/teichoic acid export membrane protein
MMFFGQEFKIGAYALIFIALGQIANVIVGPAGYINTMTGNPRYSLYNNFIVLFLNIAMNYMLIPLMGINGAAIATAVSVLIANFIRLFFVYSKLKIHPYSVDYFKITLAIFLSYFISNFINQFLINTMHDLIVILIITIIFFSLFSVFYYIFGISKEDKFILNKMKKKITSFK